MIFKYVCRMRGNTFGKVFCITTFGESHGEAIGVVIDGCPAGLKIDTAFLQQELNRRRPGQNALSSPRTEDDTAEIISGVFEGVATGAPICILIRNTNVQSKDYSHLKHAFRPSHADFTWQQKFGLRDYRGGGRASARETATRVAAGAIAKMLLAEMKIRITAHVSQVGEVVANEQAIQLNNIEQNDVRCADAAAAVKMKAAIEEAKAAGDSLGGIISCVIENCPTGLGEPVFDKLHADLGKAMLSIHTVKGFEIGSGFAAAAMRGSQHNDLFETKDGKIVTRTNHSGGVQGGISNGMNICFRVAFKPVATIQQTQASVNDAGEAIQLEGKGRHDVCVVPRAVPIVESMAALVLADHLLRQRTARL